MSSWRIIYDKRVTAIDLPALDTAVKQRIQQAITSKLLRDPVHFGKPLRYSLAGQRSLRVGDYRIVYALDHTEHLIRITTIRHRRDVYEN